MVRINASDLDELVLFGLVFGEGGTETGTLLRGTSLTMIDCGDIIFMDNGWLEGKSFQILSITYGSGQCDFDAVFCGSDDAASPVSKTDEFLAVRGLTKILSEDDDE
jgi:hypothetical protein